MTKSLALTFVAVVSCLSFFGQGDTNFDCQADSTCDHVVDFAFTLDANQEDALTFPFTGTIAGGGVVLQWPGGGTSYPSDLSLSLCSPDGDCVAIAGYSGSLPGTSLGGWPTNWNNVVTGDNVACFSFGDLTLSGSGNWTLTGLNTYSSSAAGILFEGSVTLFTDCTPQPEPCADVTACNFGALADCTYPGCLKAHACNYNPDAGCLDDESCVYDYCGDCANGPCEWEQAFAFSLGPNEIGSQDIAFDGELVGVRVSLDWPGGGTSYPDDLSLSFCTGGACVAIEGYGGALTGELIGDWPSIWQNALEGTNEACFSFLDQSLFGDGTLTLTAQNTYYASEPDVVFEGVVTLMYACNSVTLCEDEAACNFGALTECVFPGCTDAGACNFDEAAGCDDGGCDYACLGCMDVAACNYNPEATQSDGSCTYPGCNDPEACNYDETVGCDDGTCEYEQHIFVPNTDGTYGSPVFEWCGPLPDCSNQIIGCPIPDGYIEVDHPCVELILENLATCGASWTPTCALELLLCTQYDLGCTNEAACNFDPDAGYDDNSCIFPGSPCDDGIDCTTDDILNLQCECEGQTGDADGDGLCGEDDCDDSNPGLPDALGRCDLPVAGCSNGESLNYSPETGEETACILAGDCGEPLIAPDWAHGFTGWMAPEHWAFSHPDLAALDDRALVLHGPTNGDTDTAKASITAPANLIIQFTFSYHSADANPLFDPPMVLVNGEVKQIMDYIVDTPPPGQALDETAFWFHNQPIMPSPDVAPDPALLPPEHLLPMGLLIDGADTWDYPYQMPVALEVDSGDVMTLAVATTDGQANGAAMAITAMARERYCPGCTDSGACNFDPLATHIDGSCDYSCIGCMEEEACDFDPEATLPADTCDYSCYGCMDETACNYDPDVTSMDESCDYCSCGFPPKVVATGGLNQESFNFSNATLLATDGGLAQCALLNQDVLFYGVEEGPFIDIDGASDHVLAMSVDSLLHGYGRDNFGQTTIPAGLGEVTAFSAGHTHSVAIDRTGQAWGWGDASAGQLNLGEANNLAGIEAGLYHTLAWDELGQVTVATGDNVYGQLDVPEGLLVQKMASSLHNVALTTEGEVVCWGYNEYGQCDVPAFDAPVVDVAASKRSSLALLADGSLVLWGRLESIEPIAGAVTISGNISEDYFAIMDHFGRVHHLTNLWFMSVQGPSAVALAEARPNCTEWCLDIDADGECDLVDDCIGTVDECGCQCINDINSNGICDEKETAGCMEEEALDYNRYATLSQPCEFGLGGVLDQMGQDACNYDPYGDQLAEDLTYAECGGCTDPFGCNYDAANVWDDGTCEYTSCSGCSDPLACNFNPMVEMTDSCDYCSCHWTEPMVDGNLFSSLSVSSKGEAHLRSAMNLNTIDNYGIDPGSDITATDVRSGCAGWYSAMLLMRDSSIQELNGIDESSRIRRRYRQEHEREQDLGGVDLVVRLLSAETTIPEGHDFVQVVTDGNGHLALRADGTVEAWGSETAVIGDYMVNGHAGNGVSIIEWAKSLEDIVRLEMSFMQQGVLALDSQGHLHGYSVRRTYSGIPDGFEDNIVLMRCGIQGRCVVVREDGEWALVMGEATDVDESTGESILGALGELFELGTPVDFGWGDLMSTMLYENGDVAMSKLGGGEESWPGTFSLFPASEVPDAVDVTQSGLFGVVLDVSGKAVRFDPDTTANAYNPAYPVNENNLIPIGDGFIEQFPRRMLLGPPTDCQGCPDSDGDGICDVVDDCEGEEDALGVCGGDCLADIDHDGVCDLLDRPGCTYEEAGNYDAEAMFDDGTCLFDSPNPCPTDIDGDGITDTQDLLLLLGSYSLECP